MMMPGGGSHAQQSTGVFADAGRGYGLRSAGSSAALRFPGCRENTASTIPALREKTGARIISLETFTSGNLGFVRLVTDDGQDNDLAQWRRMIRMKAVDIVQPDLCYIGGLTRALRVAEMAQRAGLRCVPHSANLSMVTLFSLHMMAAIPNAGDHVEFTIEADEWTRNLYQPALQVVEGKVAIPDQPGWGVKLNHDWLAKAQRQISKV